MHTENEKYGVVKTIPYFDEVSYQNLLNYFVEACKIAGGEYHSDMTGVHTCEFRDKETGTLLGTVTIEEPTYGGNVSIKALAAGPLQKISDKRFESATSLELRMSPTATCDIQGLDNGSFILRCESDDEKKYIEFGVAPLHRGARAYVKAREKSDDFEFTEEGNSIIYPRE